MNRVDFDATPWTSALPHMRDKVCVHGDKRLRLLEFEREFVEPDWCTRGHIGYVVSGEIELTFADHVETLKAGDGLFIPEGEAGKHMPKALSETVLLFLVESV